MERRLFGDLVVSGHGAARAASLKSLPLSLAVHAAALAILVSLSVKAVTEVTAPSRPIVFPLSARPGTSAVTANAAIRSRPPRRGQQRRVVVAAPQPAVVPDAVAPDVDILDAPTGDSPICLGCTPGDPSGVDTGGAAGPGGTGGTDEGPGDGPGAPRPVGGDIQEPRRISGAAPVYPELARRAHVQGKVVIECVIDTDGRVTDLRVITGHPLLSGAALDAVRSWQYSPTRLNGQPVRVIMTVTVNFGLDRS